MNGYFYVLTAIDLFVLSFMCILTKFSESLNKKQKRGFFLAFALIAGISVLEVVTLAVDGAPAGYRWLNILSNYLGFGLSPAVSLCLVYVMDRKKMVNFWFRAAVCCEGCYLLFLALSIPAGLVFSVSEDNVYSRGPYFCIYILMYLAAIVYLSASTIVTAREFQNRSRVLIYPLMLFLTIETIIQVALPSLHVTWLCVTLLSVLYFIYCSEMWNQLDALTGLLNQDSYLNRTAEMRRSGGGAGGVRCGRLQAGQRPLRPLTGRCLPGRDRPLHQKSLCPLRLLLPHRRRRVLCAAGKRRPGGLVRAGI